MLTLSGPYIPSIRESALSLQSQLDGILRTCITMEMYFFFFASFRFPLFICESVALVPNNICRRRAIVRRTPHMAVLRFDSGDHDLPGFLPTVFSQHCYGHIFLDQFSIHAAYKRDQDVRRWVR